eukprot:gene12946-8801_t
MLSTDADAWVACAFHPTGTAVFRVEGQDRGATLTALLPPSMFSEYTSSDVRCRVHLATFQRSLLLLGAEALTGRGTTVVTLAYTTAQDKFSVCMADSEDLDAAGEEAGGAGPCPGAGRSIAAVLETRPMPSMMLDLRFEDSLVEGEAALEARVLRDVLQDFGQIGCPEVRLLLASASPGSPCDLRLEGSSADVELVGTLRGDRGEEGVGPIGLPCTGPSGVPQLSRTRASTTVSTSHLMLAGGCRLRSGGSVASNAVALGGSERVQLRINAVHQLSVVHTKRCGDASITVSAIRRGTEMEERENSLTPIPLPPLPSTPTYSPYSYTHTRQKDIGVDPPFILHQKLQHLAQPTTTTRYE